jgi:hypothetical protein
MKTRGENHPETKAVKAEVELIHKEVLKKKLK